MLAAFSSPAISGIWERTSSFPNLYALAGSSDSGWQGKLTDMLSQPDIHLPSVGATFISKNSRFKSDSVQHGALTKRNARLRRKCDPQLASLSSGEPFRSSCIKKADSGYISSDPQSPPTTQEKPVFPSPLISQQFAAESTQLRQRAGKSESQLEGLVKAMETLVIATDAALTDTDLILPMAGLSLESEQEVIKQLDEGYDSLPPFERTVSYEKEEKPAEEQAGSDLVREVQLLEKLGVPEEDLSNLLLKDFLSLPAADRGVMMDIINGFLKLHNINPDTIPESRFGKEKMMKFGQGLTQVSSYINTILAWGAYAGAAYIIYQIPSDSVTAVILVETEACEKGEALSGKVMTFQLNGQHHLPNALIAAIYLGPVFMNTFLKTLLDRVGNKLTYRAARHVCKVENCLYLDPKHGSPCSLSNWEAYQFFSKMQKLGRDHQRIIQNALLIQKDGKGTTWVKSDVPLSAGIGEIVEGLVIKRNKGYIPHALIYGSITALWVSLWIFQRPVEVMITASLANATIDADMNTTNCTAINDSSAAEVEGLVTGFEPMYAGYIGKLIAAWTAIYIIPGLIPYAQVGAQGLMKLANSGVKWCFSWKEKGR